MTYFNPLATNINAYSLSSENNQNAVNLTDSEGKHSINIGGSYFQNTIDRAIGENAEQSGLTLTANETLSIEKAHLIQRTFDYICDYIMDSLCGTDIQGFKIQFEKLLTQNLNDDEFDLAFEELEMMVNEENRSKVFAIQLQSSDIQLASGQGTVSYYINYIDKTGENCNLRFERGPCSSIVDAANDRIARHPVMSWYEAILSL